jgi:hypothetical protein
MMCFEIYLKSTTVETIYKATGLRHKPKTFMQSQSTAEKEGQRLSKADRA